MKRFLNGILRSSRDLLIVSILAIARFFQFAVGQLLLETFLAVSIIGFSYLFSSWGLSLHFALVLAIISTIALTLSLAVLKAYVYSKLYTSSDSKEEIKLAKYISRTLTNKTSTEWNEYQDWLHDILLARRQLLDANCPQWKVKIITYRRLGVFCIVVGIGKVRQVATRIGRSQ